MAGYERKVKALLKKHGLTLLRRSNGSHDIWGKGDLEVSVPAKILKRHTANAILKDAGVQTKL